MARPRIDFFVTAESKFFSMKVCAVVFLWICGSSCGAARVASTLEYTIMEEVPTGSVIGNVKRDSHLESEYNEDDLRRLRFHFRSAESRDLFSLDERSGIITTSRRIDRERMCPAPRDACDVTVDVTVRPTNYFRLIRVVVHVADVNDNRPSFDDDHVTVYVMETAQPGTLFVLPSADDADSGDNGVKEYQLRIDGNETVPFELLVTDQAGGSKDVRLRLSGRLDRESVSRYSVVVVAFDGGQPQRSASLVVNIVITDTNDNIPQFDRSSYETEVREDTPEQTTVARVHASDADAGENGHVTYRWSDQTSSTYGSVFGIDAETGDVFVKSPLDYEQQQIYKLTVMAVDSGPAALPVFAKLTIRVVDVNDNSPVIVVNALTGSSVAEVREHVDPTGTFVAHVAVTDTDTGQSGQTHCQLDANDHFRLEPLPDSGEYKLTTTSTFDREDTDRYSVILVCRDEGSPSRSTTATIVVRVADINDHAPQLPSDLIHVSVVENNPWRSVLTTVNATDRDIGVNAQLRYSLSPVVGAGTAPHRVTIDPVTGVVATNWTFDYEEGLDDLRYLVTVRDSGQPVLSATATLQLTVIDSNDNRPRFDRRVYHVTIPEDVPVGTSVGRVNATDDDADTPRFSHVIYALSTLSDSFKVDEESGTLRTIRRLDRERQASYTMFVTASDGPSSLPVTAQVGVTVDDVNDNRPTMLFPSPDRFVVQLLASRDDLSHGALVTRLDATDPDDGRNAELEYAVEYGNEGGLFEVDRHTGAVTVAADGGLDRSRPVYRLVVSATDRGTPPLRTVADLEIRVNASSWSPPAGALESATSLLADTSGLIVLSGLIVAVFLVLTLVVITVVCFRRHSRRRRKYRSVSRDPQADLPLKSFPEVGGPTQTYHTGCDLGFSTTGSVCLCRDPSGGLGDTTSVGSNFRPRSGCRGCNGCDVTMTSHKLAESEYHPRCTAEMVGARDLRVTSPGSSSCCGSCCEVHQAPLQGPRSVSSCCSAPSCHHARRHHHHGNHHHHHHHHHRRQRGSRQAATSASSCSSSSPPSSPPHSLRRYPLPPSPAPAHSALEHGQHLSASPFELRRLPEMLKAMESRYDAEHQLTSGPSQLPIGALATADSEFDVASSSTSCADSGRGLSCEVHDEPVKALPAPVSLVGRITEPLGRNMATFRRGTEPGEKNVDAVGRGTTAMTIEDTLMAHTAALDACRQTCQSQPRAAVNVVGNAGGAAV